MQLPVSPPQVSEHGLGLPEAHAHQVLRAELPASAAGRAWALACAHVHLIVPPARGGVWSFPHPSAAAALRPLLLQNGPGLPEHAELSDHFLALADPRSDGTFAREDPHVLLALTYHLCRCGPAKAEALVSMLRSPHYSERLAGMPCMPPAPLMLMTVLCRDAEGHERFAPEFEYMARAVSSGDEPERARQVSRVLQRIAKRLELTYLVKASKAAQRRKSVAVHRHGQQDVTEVSASTIQRGALTFIQARRKLRRRGI